MNSYVMISIALIQSEGSLRLFFNQPFIDVYSRLFSSCNQKFKEFRLR